MKGNRKHNIGVLALGILILWAKAPVRAQAPEEDTRADSATDTDTDTDADGLHPPHLIDSPPPAFPPGREGTGLHPTVILFITVTAEANVTDIIVEHSASADFDAAAVEAVQNWVFEPARKGDEPVSSRIRVAVHFEEPDVGVHDQTGAYAGVATATPAEEDARPPDGFHATAEVDPEKLRGQDRGAADFTIDRKVLDAAPNAGRVGGI